MKACIRIENLSVSFHQQKAIADLTFQVMEGEIFGFLGPSGAGKTTTIKALTKQLKMAQGSIELFGKSLAEHHSSVYDQIGIMSDSNDVYENLSVYDNLKFFASIKGMDESVVDPLLKKIGLYEARKKIVKKLSKGMRQRLLLATTLVHKPKLLFLDEPTASLDPRTTAEIHDLFRMLNREGTTIFLTTHSMDEAEKLCDRVAFLDQGRIVELGSCASLKLKYAQDTITVQFSQEGTSAYTKDLDGLKQIAAKAALDSVVRIHSNEPTLETIFLTVTGRDSYEVA